MTRRTVSKSELLAILKGEIASDPRFEGLVTVTLFGVEEGGDGNWTASFSGVMPGTPESDAMREIMGRASAQYDVAWVTRH